MKWIRRNYLAHTTVNAAKFYHITQDYLQVSLFTGSRSMNTMNTEPVCRTPVRSVWFSTSVHNWIGTQTKLWSPSTIHHLMWQWYCPTAGKLKNIMSLLQALSTSSYFVCRGNNSRHWKGLLCQDSFYFYFWVSFGHCVHAVRLSLLFLLKATWLDLT